MDNTAMMRDEDIGRLLLKFSLPAIAGMLINALYNVVDRIFVGRGVGSLAIAATTVAFPIMIIVMAVSVLIGVGATALISIRLGEQKKEEAEKIAGNATLLLVLLPLCLTVIYLLFPDPILKTFGASPEVLPYARDFMQIIMLGSAISSISIGMNNFIRAQGDAKTAMYTQLIGATVNIVLNYIFIFQLGLGIKGSALATVSGQFISALWVLGYFFTGRSLVKIRLKNFRLQAPVLLSIVSIGCAPFALQLANSVQQLIINKTLTAYGGDLALSAVGIIMSIVAIMLMPILGISQGMQPLVGFNYGARQYDRVKEALKKAIIAASGISIAGYLVIQIWPSQIASLFTKDTALIQLTADAMQVYLAIIFILGFQVVGPIYFQAVGKGLKATILGLSRQVLVFIPLLLLLPRFWGINGVWRAAPFSDAIAVMITATFLYFEIKSLPQTEVSKQLPAPLNEADLKQM